MSSLSGLAFPFLLGFAVALGSALGIRFTKRWHGRFSLDSVTGPQKFHSAPTPRIGGLAVFAGLWAVVAVLDPPLDSLLAAVCASVAIAFASGLVEDCTGKVPSTVRLAATICAGVAFCFATGYAVETLDFAWLDAALAVPGIAIAFTAFAIGGMAHAMNIVDGFHGLAAGSTIIALSAFALVSLRAGDPDMVGLSLLGIGVHLGFFLVNFPFGHLFLGDGGAYLAGGLLGCISVMVPMRNPEVSPWASLVILAYPVFETLVSIVRKVLRTGQPFVPDRLHLHMLVCRRYGRRIAEAAGKKELVNPVTGMLMWGGPILSAALATLFAFSRDWLLFSCALLLSLYLLVYRRASMWFRPSASVSSASYAPEIAGMIGSASRAAATDAPTGGGDEGGRVIPGERN